MKQDQKRDLATLAMIAALCVSTAQADLLQDITIWIWNYFVYFSGVGSMMGCWYIGLWGLFWDDDDGLMTNTCLELYGGSMVTFPVEYQFN